MSLPGKTREINGINYHVYDEGDSDHCVLMLHGMPDTSSIWKDQADALLKAGYRVVAPDMLGFGKTDKPQDKTRYEAEYVVADILVLIDQLGANVLDIVGHDWGEFVAWELVLTRPELFRRHVALSVSHPGVMFGNMTMEAIKENWYMFMNTQEHAAELYALNDCQYLRESWIPSHPELDEVASRMSDPIAMNSMLNWDRANQVVTFYLAYLQGQLEYNKCQIPTMGLWSTGDIYLSES